jgi:hypothetical protein
MSHPAAPAARTPGGLPWPAGWARRTRGPQYRPAAIGAVLCLLLAGSLAIRNLADGFLVVVLALGMLAFALRPAPSYPVRVALGDATSGATGVRFPLRITNPFTARHRPYVTLTPAAVVAGNGDALIIPWSAITEVRATTLVTGVPHPLLPPPRQNWLLIGVADRTAVLGPGTPERALRRFGANTVLGFPATRLLTDPVVFFHALHYYLDNPAARAELACEAALHRIRARRVQPHDA